MAISCHFKMLFQFFNCLLYMFYMCFTRHFYFNVSRVSLFGCQDLFQRCNLAKLKTSKFSGHNGGESCPTRKIPFIAHRIHGTGIFTYICFFLMVNVGEYTIHGSHGLVEQKKGFFSWVLSLKQPSHHLIPHYPTGN